MENASKALIIAGSILLAILIVGLGMFIYQQAAGAMEGLNFDTQQIQSYNQRFNQYKGTQLGTTLRQLCDEVISHNATNADTSLQVGISYGSKGKGKQDNDTTSNINDAVSHAEIEDVRNAMKAGKLYTVTPVYGKSGRIISLTIADK